MESLKLVAKIISSGESIIERLNYVNKIGNIFLDSKGKVPSAEIFLRILLTADPDDCESSLGIATANLPDARKDVLVKNIKENCFIFLMVYQEKVQPSTKRILEQIKNKPPYADFLPAVEEKIKVLKRKYEAS